MLKRVSLFLVLSLLVLALAGCAGTPVIYMTNCECPTAAPATEAPAVTAAPVAEEAPAAEGAVKTGLYIGASAADSKSATAEANGEAKYDVTVVAVTIDDAGVITDCIIDSLGASVAFDAAGAITSDTAAAVQTKNELGEAYGMKKISPIGKEYSEQMQALADWCVGKTLEEVLGLAYEDADLKAGCTVWVGDQLIALEKAVKNAK